MCQLTPDGVFRSKDGRPEKLKGWRMNPQVAERVLATLKSRTNPIVVDYEHQTLLAEQNGQPAPAAGWIDPASVQYTPGEGLFAPIQWTDRARAWIECNEYRYLSPVLLTDEDTGDVLELLHVALVNDAAVDGMDRVVALRARFAPPSNASGGALASAPHVEDVEVNELLKKLVAALGLPADTTEQGAHDAVVALKARADLVQEVRSALGVAEGANVSDAVVALKAKAASTAPDLSGFVPKAMYEELRGQVVALKAHGDTAEIDRLIDEGLADGRIAGKATADYLRQGGLVALKAHLADAPGIAALKATQTQGRKPDGQGGGDELSEAERRVLANTGVSADQFKAAAR
ncbi:MAG: hypothetical protein BSR46_01680 [Candidatus Dactylopiibacterium carminicum]|nr:MAG: hypothetical protein BSR46_01680 [Candidatus Dactylopiibacterium carminicum]